MQAFGLTIDKFLDHAAAWFGEREVVEGEAGLVRRRTGYAALRERNNRMSGALAALGLRSGDRVGTLAWNTLHHFELYYAVMGAGMVCHTLNPRLSIAHLAAMIVEADDRVLAIAADLLPLWDQLAPSCPGVKHVVVLDGGGADAAAGHSASVRDYEALLERDGRSADWGGFAEETPAGLCHTSGTTGAPKGVVYTHRELSAHPAGSAGRRGRADRARQPAARGADVPCQWLGPAVRGAGGGQQAGAAGALARRGEPRPADARRGRDRRGRRPDRVARAGRPSRGERYDPAGVAAGVDRRLGLPRRARPADRGPARRRGAGELGHDRAVADRHDRAAGGSRRRGERRAAAGRPRPPPVRRAGCRTARAARHAGSPQGQGPQRRRSLLRRDRDGARRGRLVRHRRPRDDRRRRLADHSRPRQGPDQVGRRVDQSHRDRDCRRPPPRRAPRRRDRPDDPKWGERPVLVVESDGSVGDAPALLALLRGKVVDWWIPGEVAGVAAMPARLSMDAHACVNMSMFAAPALTLAHAA